MLVLILNRYGTISKFQIVQHVQTHVELKFRRKMHCSKCDYVTISDHNMKLHANRVSCNKIKPKIQLPCYCGKAFSSKQGLDNHIKFTHQQQKNHSCTICEKAFPFLFQLKVLIFHL